jgi:hypothetical protein
MLEKKYAITARGIIYITNDLTQIVFGLSHIAFWTGLVLLALGQNIGATIMVISLVIGLPAMVISSLLIKER